MSLSSTHCHHQLSVVVDRHRSSVSTPEGIMATYYGLQLLYQLTNHHWGTVRWRRSAGTMNIIKQLAPEVVYRLNY